MLHIRLIHHERTFYNPNASRGPFATGADPGFKIEGAKEIHGWIIECMCIMGMFYVFIYDNFYLRMYGKREAWN